MSWKNKQVVFFHNFKCNSLWREVQGTPKFIPGQWDWCRDWGWLLERYIAWQSSRLHESGWWSIGIPRMIPFLHQKTLECEKIIPFLLVGRYTLSASLRVALNWPWASISPWISSNVWTMNMSTRSSLVPSSQLLKGWKENFQKYHHEAFLMNYNIVPFSKEDCSCSCFFCLKSGQLWPKIKI